MTFAFVKILRATRPVITVNGPEPLLTHLKQHGFVHELRFSKSGRTVVKSGFFDDPYDFGIRTTGIEGTLNIIPLLDEIKSRGFLFVDMSISDNPDSVISETYLFEK